VVDVEQVMRKCVTTCDKCGFEIEMHDPPGWLTFSAIREISLHHHPMIGPINAEFVYNVCTECKHKLIDSFTTAPADNSPGTAPSPAAGSPSTPPDGAPPDPRST
jgi:hypothetical protein